MARTIVTKADIPRIVANAFPDFAGGDKKPPIEPDDYKTKLMKYIPAEVISLYVTLEAAINASAHTAADTVGPFWLIFIVGLIGTPIYLWRINKVSKGLQLAVSTGAFAVWVFTLGGPFEGWDWYQGHKIYAALILPIYTFAVAAIDP
jgi:hypothetical protein